MVSTPAWNAQTGEWVVPNTIWKTDQDIPDNAPESWFAKSGGNYYVGLSFHFSPFNHPSGKGLVDGSIRLQPSSFSLARMQDPYNSWGVSAKQNEHLTIDCMNHWDWLPGITVYDDSAKFTLPSSELAAYAGTEWADNDRRVFHGIYDDSVWDRLLTKYFDVVNRITGPRYAGWPFGYRQLTEAVSVWIHRESGEVHCMLLAASRQSGDKFSYFNRQLFDPGSSLGDWDKSPPTWECRQVVKFLYKSRLLLLDGFHDIALVSSASALEAAFHSIVLYLEHNDAAKASKLVKRHAFLDRAKVLLAGYGFALPQAHFDAVKAAYKQRNKLVHQLGSVTHEDAAQSISDFEAAVQWYWQNIP